MGVRSTRRRVGQARGENAKRFYPACAGRIEYPHETLLLYLPMDTALAA